MSRTTSQAVDDLNGCNNTASFTNFLRKINLIFNLCDDGFCEPVGTDEKISQLIEIMIASEHNQKDGILYDWIEKYETDDHDKPGSDFAFTKFTQLTEAVLRVFRYHDKRNGKEKRTFNKVHNTEVEEVENPKPEKTAKLYTEKQLKAEVAKAKKSQKVAWNTQSENVSSEWPAERIEAYNSRWCDHCYNAGRDARGHWSDSCYQYQREQKEAANKGGKSKGSTKGENGKGKGGKKGGKNGGGKKGSKSGKGGGKVYNTNSYWHGNKYYDGNMSHFG